MIDPQAPFASWFLWIAGGSFLFCYALPLLLVPLRWAKLFQWPTHEASDLTIYFGRCLGGVALAITIVCLQSAPRISTLPWVLEMTFWASIFMTLVHIAGAIQRTQPWTENLEIILYAAIAGLSYFARLSMLQG